ncbi:MAG: tetratricopeptide repeat protein [Bacteroidia bacterium]
MSERNEEFAELIERFENMINTGSPAFFDSEELEDIIEHYFATNRLDMAKSAIEKALDQYPYSAAFKISKAQYLSANHNTLEALNILNQLEHIEPSNPDLYLTRAYIYSQSGLSEQAIENYKMALKYSDDKDEIYMALGVEFMNQEKSDDAIFYLKKALQFNPGNDLALSELALCFEIAGKSQESIDFFTKFIDDNPYNQFAWFNMGVSYSRIGDHEKAIDAYDYAIAINDKFSSAYFNKGTRWPTWAALKRR